MARIRIYGKELRRWTVTDESGRDRIIQTEYAYKEYNEQGELIGTGSEDLTPSLEKMATLQGRLYTWDGERRNRGGFRWFDDRGFYRIRKSDRREFKEMMKHRYSAQLAEFRTF